MHLVFFTLLATITFYELTEKIIPNAVTYPGMVLGLAFAAGYQDLNLLFSLLGVVFGLFIGALVNRYSRWISSRDGLGGGAIKMLGMVGAFLGFPGLAITLMINGLIFLIFALIVAVIRKESISLSATYEMGPALAISAIITSVFIPLPINF